MPSSSKVQPTDAIVPSEEEKKKEEAHVPAAPALAKKPKVGERKKKGVCGRIRLACASIVQNKQVQGFVLLAIVADILSVIALAKKLVEEDQLVLFNWVIFAILALEVTTRIVWKGTPFFKNFLSVLEFFVVILTLVFLAGDFDATVAPLRALRPLNRTFGRLIKLARTGVLMAGFGRAVIERRTIRLFTEFTLFSLFIGLCLLAFMPSYTFRHELEPSHQLHFSLHSVGLLIIHAPDMEPGTMRLVSEEDFDTGAGQRRLPEGLGRRLDASSGYVSRDLKPKQRQGAIAMKQPGRLELNFNETQLEDLYIRCEGSCYVEHAGQLGVTPPLMMKKLRIDNGKRMEVDLKEIDVGDVVIETFAWDTVIAKLTFHHEAEIYVHDGNLNVGLAHDAMVAWRDSTTFSCLSSPSIPHYVYHEEAVCDVTYVTSSDEEGTSLGEDSVRRKLSGVTTSTDGNTTEDADGEEVTVTTTTTTPLPEIKDRIYSKLCAGHSSLCGGVLCQNELPLMQIAVGRGMYITRQKATAGSSEASHTEELSNEKKNLPGS
jgi:hypothetical protein